MYCEVCIEFCVVYLNGQDELGEFCECYGVEYFLLGGGFGICMVCVVDELVVVVVVNVVCEMVDLFVGCIVFDFFVCEKGFEICYFEECGLQVFVGLEEVVQVVVV